MNNLKFDHDQAEKLTLEQLKARYGGGQIRVKLNPKKNSAFFTVGSLTGAVASKNIVRDANGKPTGVTLEEPVASFVEGDNGCFWMIHEEGGETISVL